MSGTQYKSGRVIKDKAEEGSQNWDHEETSAIPKSLNCNVSIGGNDTSRCALYKVYFDSVRFNQCKRWIEKEGIRGHCSKIDHKMKEA